MSGLQDTMIKELYTLEETIAKDIFLGGYLSMGGTFQD